MILPMYFADAHMAEITIILDRSFGERLPEAVEILKGTGVEVTEANEDQSVVEGVCEVHIIEKLKALPAVKYVRTGLIWSADYPVGDARDRNGV